MSTIANYSFLPWLRQGLSNSIPKEDNDPSVLLRASIDVNVHVKPTNIGGVDGVESTVPKTVQLYGPGDIIGIESKAIVKIEPRRRIFNFEPNYLPYIDFYDEDFPWRYTPAKAKNQRIRPWITLVVLSEDEFEKGKNKLDKPLPYFSIKSGKKATELFPNPSELWAWAHVHVNKDLSNGAETNMSDESKVNDEINQIINSDPDNAYSRIICPRKLVENKSYHAFLIPSFETGRLAGLGQDIPNGTVATTSAWNDDSKIDFPYYYSWSFRTGNTGDFEYLVKLLKPQAADKRVGVRDIDVIHPGSNLPAINNEDLLGVLKLGGALRVPFDTLNEIDKLEVKKFDEWDENPYPHPFTTSMANRINLADDYAKAFKTIQEANFDAGIVSEMDLVADPDPVITSPLYGRWHALQERLLKEPNGAQIANNKNWIHELNLDPRFRSAAGLGTKVIQQNQEEYMQSAWEQVGSIIEANNKIRWAQLAKEVSFSWYSKHITLLEASKAYLFTAPVQKRVMYQDLTVHKQVIESKIPAVVSSGTFRSITRPRGRFMKQIASRASSFTSTVTPFNIVERINDGILVIVPPKMDPKGGINLSDAADAAEPKNIPPVISESLKKNNNLMMFTLIIAAVFFLLAILFFQYLLIVLICLGVSAIALWFYFLLKKWKKEIQNATLLEPDNFTASAVDEIPSSPDFKIATPDAPVAFTVTGSTDSAEAARFKIALKDAFTLTDIHFTETVRKPILFKEVVSTIITSIDPNITIPKRTLSGINIPLHIKDNFKEFFAPVMAYPCLDVPMYKPLVDLSSEYFLPNINLIPENSITLLENNQKFIESYMVGINHEMSRELLWREYPTDQRGSYFRQFWDVKSFMPLQPIPNNIKEQLYDIPKIHTWSKTNTSHTVPGDPSSPLKNELGQHNQRALGSGKTQLVLVIRGELFKKYSKAVVYAHRADWGVNGSDVPDVKEERRFAEISAGEEATKIKTPLFKAMVDPDVYFFGFDLDDEEAKGTLNPTKVSDDPGWFFVIKERPGEPRFGLDIEKNKNENGDIRLINWNNLSWPDVGTADGNCILLNKDISLMEYDHEIDEENRDNDDDKQAGWSPNTNAAEIAYILYQIPVLVGVHASRMLPK